MIKTKTINQQDFEKLLKWLNPDREIAGHKYELIRTKLTKIFQIRGSQIPEELADKTIDRVIQKLDFIVDSYEGNPELYFYAVGKNIFLEQTRTVVTEELNPFIAVKEAEENFEETDKYKCLKDCLKELSENERGIIIEYYQENKQAKIEKRKELAKKLGESRELLRIKTYRIRLKLQKCIKKCLKKV